MSFQRVWRRFAAGRRTLGPSPGVREAWAQGRRCYHAWVLVIDDPRVEARRAEVASALEVASPGSLSPWCARASHVTVWVAGWEPPGSHPREGARVPLEVGRASAFSSCPILEVRCPGEVRGSGLRALRATFPGREERWAPYRPHLTVGLWRRSEPVGPLVGALRSLRRLPWLRTEGVLRLAHIDALADEGVFHVEQTCWR